MRYALLLYLDPEMARLTTEAEAQAEMAVYGQLTAELAEAGMLRGGEAFMPASTAVVVTVENGQRRLSAADESPRELSGYYIVECDEDQALDIAARMPVATHGAVEVRPLMDLPGPGDD
jgi:hypothetical protein